MKMKKYSTKLLVGYIGMLNGSGFVNQHIAMGVAQYGFSNATH
jgi:hypothetical protein